MSTKQIEKAGKVIEKEDRVENGLITFQLAKNQSKSPVGRSCCGLCRSCGREEGKVQKQQSGWGSFRCSQYLGSRTGRAGLMGLLQLALNQ